MSGSAVLLSRTIFWCQKNSLVQLFFKADHVQSKFYCVTQNVQWNPRGGHPSAALGNFFHCIWCFVGFSCVIRSNKVILDHLVHALLSFSILCRPACWFLRQTILCCPVVQFCLYFSLPLISLLRLNALPQLSQELLANKNRIW